ncbi:MAG: N-acetylmuramoyl-L-alanine amidase [Clostridia bacterium]|nr:N-acetylmuramoyl-L-alanine amidase [Clostridia bacterium]
MKNSIYITFRLKGFICCTLAFLLGLSSVLLIFSQEETSSAVGAVAVMKRTVIIDAGHGGGDGGTQSSDGTLEKDINLQISLKLEKILKLMGFETVMIRTEDKLICSDECDTVRERKVSDLNNRLEIVRSFPGAVFVSIHQNYFTESKYSGAQVFYSPNNENSKALAESLQQSIVSRIQNDNNRKIKKSGDDIYLLKKIEGPAVMVECGFMSNPSESLKLKDEAYQKELALSIAAGLTDYYSDIQEEI